MLDCSGREKGKKCFLLLSVATMASDEGIGFFPLKTYQGHHNCLAVHLDFDLVKEDSNVTST